MNAALLTANERAEARGRIEAVEHMFDNPWITDPYMRTRIPSEDAIIRLARWAIHSAEVLRAAGEDVPESVTATLKLS